MHKEFYDRYQGQSMREGTQRETGWSERGALRRQHLHGGRSDTQKQLSHRGQRTPGSGNSRGGRPDGE